MEATARLIEVMAIAPIFDSFEVLGLGTEGDGAASGGAEAGGRGLQVQMRAPTPCLGSPGLPPPPHPHSLPEVLGASKAQG